MIKYDCDCIKGFEWVEFHRKNYIGNKQLILSTCSRIWPIELTKQWIFESEMQKQ